MNLYKTLGVDANATSADVKFAYRKLAKVHHPDAGGDAKKFNEIHKAYKALSTAEGREHYKMTGRPITGAPNLADLMIKMFQEEVSAGNFDCDIVESMSKKLGLQISHVKSQIAGLESEKCKIEKTKGRVKKVEGGENLFEQILDGRLSELERTIKKMSEGLGRANDMLEELHNYVDVNPTEMPFKSTPTITYSQSNTGA